MTRKFAEGSVYVEDDNVKPKQKEITMKVPQLNLQPIFQKGQKMKVSLVAIAAAFLGAGGQNLPDLWEGVQHAIQDEVIPVHGTILKLGYEPMATLRTYDDRVVKIAIPQEDIDTFVIGQYYVQRQGYEAPSIEGLPMKIDKRHSLPAPEIVDPQG